MLPHDVRRPNSLSASISSCAFKATGELLRLCSFATAELCLIAPKLAVSPISGTALLSPSVPCPCWVFSLDSPVIIHVPSAGSRPRLAIDHLASPAVLQHGHLLLRLHREATPGHCKLLPHQTRTEFFFSLSLPTTDTSL